MPYDQSTLEQYRDAADREHKAYWEQNGGSPHPEAFFPGYEAGWNFAGSNDVPQDDEGVAQLAKGQAQSAGQPEDAWEWQHGFKRGAREGKQAQQQ